MVGRERCRAEILTDHLQQRLVIIEVGHGDARNDGQQIEQAVGESGALFQLQIHDDSVCGAKVHRNPPKSKLSEP